MSARPIPTPAPALAMIVVSDIPAGLRALDALVKQAPVEILAAGTIQRAGFMIAFGGQVEPVQQSHARALDSIGTLRVDDVLLAHADERIVPAWLKGRVNKPGAGDTLGVLQVASPPTLVRAVDAALKGALVELIELRLADGLGGRAIATLWGETHDVQAAVALANAATALGRSDGATSAVIPNLDPAVRRSLADGTRFFKEWRG